MASSKSCACCSLETGCFVVAFHTLVLAALLLAFNIHELLLASDYIVWTRVVSFIVAFLLIFAAFMLLCGLFRKSPEMLAFWMGIFSLFIIYQIAMVCWQILYFVRPDMRPSSVAVSMFASIVVFGILIIFDVWAWVTVHRYRRHLSGRGLQPVAVMA